jgi:hypothetical protein
LSMRHSGGTRAPDETAPTSSSSAVTAALGGDRRPLADHCGEAYRRMLAVRSLSVSGTPRTGPPAHTIG